MKEIDQSAMLKSNMGKKRERCQPVENKADPVHAALSSSDSGPVTVVEIEEKPGDMNIYEIKSCLQNIIDKYGATVNHVQQAIVLLDELLTDVDRLLREEWTKTD